VPGGQEERGAAAASPAPGVRGVRSGVDDDSVEVVAGAAAAGDGAALRVLKVVAKLRVAAAAAVRASGWAVTCRLVSLAACRKHVRQIMVGVEVSAASRVALQVAGRAADRIGAG
jgi:hypothetical protein